MQQRMPGATGERGSAIGLGCVGLVSPYGEQDDQDAAGVGLTPEVLVGIDRPVHGERDPEIMTGSLNNQ